MSGKAASNSRTRLQSAGRARHVVPVRRRLPVGQTAGLRRVIAREPADNNVDFIVKVTDDFPEAILVIPRELDVIETYLGCSSMLHWGQAQRRIPHPRWTAPMSPEEQNSRKSSSLAQAGRLPP
jgi:hypothetical protein